MLVLALESSCDETAVALFDSEQGLVGHHLHSQAALHAKYGGVVPELASRDHIRKALPLLEKLLQDCERDLEEIDAVAYTAGPGLVGALLVGASIARAIAFALDVPALGVHHMEGHLLAPMLEENPPDFPFVALLVSGGHTQLVAVKEVGEYRILGQSIDDAVGEAFDKTAKLLGLPYPAGPQLAALAEKGRVDRFSLPRPMVNRPGLDFSFSGLKTAALTCIAQNRAQNGELDEQTAADVAAAFQEAAVQTLLIKCRRALTETGLERLVIAGGVSANRRLRALLEETASQEGWQVFLARQEFCTDNAAMIAYAGCQRLVAGQCDDLTVSARPRWPMEDLSQPSRQAMQADVK